MKCLYSTCRLTLIPDGYTEVIQDGSERIVQVGLWAVIYCSGATCLPKFIPGQVGF